MPPSSFNLHFAPCILHFAIVFSLSVSPRLGVSASLCFHPRHTPFPPNFHSQFPATRQQRIEHRPRAVCHRKKLPRLLDLQFHTHRRHPPHRRPLIQRGQHIT